MTREEAYSSGWHKGRKWAEEDIRDGVRVEPEGVQTFSDEARAEQLGMLRGYRDAWARFNAGMLTPEMFEHAPRGPR